MRIHDILLFLDDASPFPVTLINTNAISGGQTSMLQCPVS